MAQIRIRKRGKTFSYIFEAGKIDGKRKVVEKSGFPTKAEAYKADVVNVRRQIINLNKRNYFLTTKKLIKQTIKAIRRQLRYVYREENERILRQSNTQITQNLYTHKTLKLQEEIVAIFDKNLQTNS